MEKNNSPRILVFTVTAWNSHTGGNPWETMLGSYEPACIANICIRDEIPDSKVCGRYFQISENRIIRSLYHRGEKTGREILPEEKNSNSVSHDLEIHNRRYNKMRQHRSYTMLLARELIWALGRWHTPELDSFIEVFKPDIILHSMDGYIHLNRIVDYAINLTGAKTVGYVWDDNFTYKQSHRLGYKLYRYFQRRSLRKLAADTDRFFAIAPQTKKEADEYFGIDCAILTKPINKTPSFQAYTPDSPLKLLYSGNLLIGRDKSLMRVSKAMRQLDKDGKNMVLDVYTTTELSQLQKADIEFAGCKIHPPLPQKEILEIQKKADVLLFLEALDGPYAGFARLSFSTKITDYLSTGRCIFAVGSADSAPMHYFEETKSAICSTNEAGILSQLTHLLDAPDCVRQYAENACRCGIENHSREKTVELFEQTVDELWKNDISGGELRCEATSNKRDLSTREHRRNSQRNSQYGSRCGD